MGLRTNPSSRLWRTLGTLLGLAFAWLLLCIPAAQAPEPLNPHKKPFSWNQDPRWFALEARFREYRALGCDAIAARLDAALRRSHRLVDAMDARAWNPDAALFDSIEVNIFDLGPMIGTCPERLENYIHLVTRTRSAVKRQSQRWDVTAQSTRDRMYRLLFGGRAALEEVMLQDSMASRTRLVLADDEPSQTPFARILGVTIHSGDLLVSRGGAQVSALIAVGNDYPGNFSHVALVYVDEQTSLASVIESRPGTGVAVYRLEEYLADVKLRVMVLRVRSDLPALVMDPMIPHRAAMLALASARSGRIPYDVAMDLQDYARMYCSEVISSAYEKVGIRLWMGMSTISSPGVTAWLSAMGVRHFEVQEPSDLEYDPQVRVVAEWRDHETLFTDHVDNVITEAMLRRAEKGERLTYPWLMLPLGRLVKMYSWVMNSLGFTGPIPDDMSADAALRVLSFNAIHTEMKRRVLLRADEFRRQQGYVAPEWQLLEFAKQVGGTGLTLRAYFVAVGEEL
ncbi:MAG: hypothetical protein HW416_2130 [Chloroflexi bacterium]|nr:hypothetical protein [Chloroflexota bacterium]